MMFQLLPNVMQPPVNFNGGAEEWRSAVGGHSAHCRTNLNQKPVQVADIGYNLPLGFGFGFRYQRRAGIQCLLKCFLHIFDCKSNLECKWLRSGIAFREAFGDVGFG
ncbi:hypothetical protein CLV60_107295 [Dyadobacter jiangsuensis]|uniref:Uncharacterized protein n=1 Tax=Dyadobacter jiangsuensis TaxID=1591085 RepID=A0A2P8G214_9BACT|nr:hypothetical protein CLV60_107295 [Dyadobacter jiangsuensis]